MRDQGEYAQRSQTPQKHQNLGSTISTYLLGRQVEKQNAHREYEQVQDAAKVFDNSIWSKEETVSAHSQRHFDAHRNYEQVFDDLKWYRIHKPFRRRLKHHSSTRLNRHSDHDPVQVAYQAEKLVKALILVFD